LRPRFIRPKSARTAGVKKRGYEKVY